MNTESELRALREQNKAIKADVDAIKKRLGIINGFGKGVMWTFSIIAGVVTFAFYVWNTVHEMFK